MSLLTKRNWDQLGSESKINISGEEYVYNYFETILDSTDRHYVHSVMYLLAYGMTNENGLRALYCHVGGDHCGWKTCFALLQKIYGEFACYIDHKCICGKSNSYLSDKPLLTLLDKRLGYCNLDKERRPFKTSTIRMITGGDVIPIYKSATVDVVRQIQTQLHLFFHKDRLPKMDNLLLKRVITIQWPKTFDPNPEFRSQLLHNSDLFFSCFVDLLRSLNGCDIINNLPNQIKKETLK